MDFTQGIEYFNTLRRLQKPVVLLEYPGENHGLARPANQQDYTVRMKEFFDHHLKGAPAPDWLQDGMPRLKMQEHIDQRLKERRTRTKTRPPACGNRRGGESRNDKPVGIGPGGAHQRRPVTSILWLQFSLTEASSWRHQRDLAYLGGLAAGLVMNVLDVTTD